MGSMRRTTEQWFNGPLALVLQTWQSCSIAADQLSAMTSSSNSTRPRNRPASHENKLRNVCKRARDIRPGLDKSLVFSGAFGVFSSDWAPK
jgi:hypothetical protein